MPTKLRSLLAGLLILCAISVATAFAQTKLEEKKTATAAAAATAERSQTMKELDSIWKRAKKRTLD